MLGSGVLDVAIGLIFLYLLLSIICSVVVEGIARIAAMRSSNLQEGIRNLLNDTDGSGLAKKLYDHPLISGFYRAGWYDQWRGRGGKPSYIPSRTFTLALFDTIAGADRSFDQVRVKVARIDNGQVKGALLPLLDAADQDLKMAQANVESWFNDSMERVSGWYKRKVQIVLFVVALVISIALNADTFEVARTLWNDTALRESVLAAAQRSSQEALSDDIEVIRQQLNDLQLPVGWQSFPETSAKWVTKLIGLGFTAIALTLGAPFWFDMLNRVVRMRDSGPSPTTRSEG